ncbi:hypothetical protein F6X39_08815 [Paraburkholderia sp. UCT2]|nr:hypothetical protein [Paraburkholderia sp. UCT2]
MRTTFTGLYGVDAAMPSHMIDEIVMREEGHEAVEAFLDRFNHRFVTLLYRAWKKYRYPESFRAGGSDAHSRNLLCLAGFGWGDKPQRAGLSDSRMLALLGLLIQRTRTPEGLAGASASLSQPMRADTNDVAVVAFYRNPGSGDGWKYVIGKKKLEADKPLKISLMDQFLVPAGSAAHD